ncbi:hypothetical protein ABII15_02670 [Streptomyces sp. HUAS MG91]|uniref:DUF304 domain-containing protein n=1 Tax=Streptomyces tabacisoli TaxID=3156398 RepID=A0AAU8ILF7_9ACTN
MRRVRKRGKVIVAASACVVLLGFEFLLQGSQDEFSWRDFPGFLAPLPVMLYIVWRLHLNPYVELMDSSICVNNIFTRHVIPYSRIKKILGIRSILLEVSGERGNLPVVAFDAGILGKKSRDSFVRELELRMEQASVDPDAARSRAVTTGLPEYLGPGLSLFLLAVALFAS